jgi:hypothetical protein
VGDAGHPDECGADHHGTVHCKHPVADLASQASIFTVNSPGNYFLYRIDVTATAGASSTAIVAGLGFFKDTYVPRCPHARRTRD